MNLLYHLTEATISSLKEENYNASYEKDEAVC